ncbi:hypothetical protein L804_02695 [Cryptococcus deuterogattii 2001/935-1]|nr:hypothetical protein L804_02695 [Cryptococcus deuterogattii 2001/935-1]
MPRHSQQMNPGTAPGIYEHHFKKKIVEFCDILQEMNRAIIANNALPDKEICIGFIALGDLISRVWAKIILKATSKKEANLPLTLSDGSYVGRRRRAISRSS